MRRFPPVLAVCAALLGAGCAADVRPSPAPGASAADAVRYACDDGAFLSVVFGPEAAEVTMVDGSRAVLARQRSGAGVHYAAGAYDFVGRGDVAAWTATGSPPTRCQAT